MPTISATTVDLTITIGGKDVAVWRVRALGWCAWLLRVPVGVDGPPEQVPHTKPR